MAPLLDTMPLWAAFIPLGCYLMLLGAAHSVRRPVAVSGTWDGALLGAAVAGLVLVGPLALLRPATGSSPWNPVLLLLLLVLFAALALLVARPRLVIYNVTTDQMRPLVAEVVAALDPAARWAGSTAALPTRGLEVRIDGHGPTRSVSVVAAGDRLGADGWGEFCRRLRRSLGGLRVRTSPWAPVFWLLGAGVLAAAGWCAVAGVGAGISAAQPAATAVQPADPPALDPQSHAPQPHALQPGATDASPRRSDGA